MSKTVVDKLIVETRGRNSKYSSKVFVVRLIEREQTELDRWFGPVDEIRRKKDYDNN